MPAVSFCSRCGASAVPTTVTPGSILIELVLWCVFLIPGVLYSLWRLSARTRNTCPHCKGPGMLPLNSPQAVMMRQLQWRSNMLPRVSNRLSRTLPGHRPSEGCANLQPSG
jgi:hypothetical protein